MIHYLRKGWSAYIAAIMVALLATNCPAPKKDDNNDLLLGALLLSQNRPQFAVSMVGELGKTDSFGDWAPVVVGTGSGACGSNDPTVPACQDSKFDNFTFSEPTATNRRNITNHARIYSSARIIRLTKSKEVLDEETIQQVTSGADARGRFSLSFRLRNLNNVSLELEAFALPSATIQSVINDTINDSGRVSPTNKADFPNKFDTGGNATNLDNPQNYTESKGKIKFTINGIIVGDFENPQTSGNIPSVTVEGNDFKARIRQIRIIRVGTYQLPNPTIGERVCDGATVRGTPVVKSGTINSDETWEGAILLQGTVDVAAGRTITVKPGTVIFGQRGSSIFFLASGNSVARLIAEGDANNPICWTSASRPGSRFPGDWGGIVTIGNAGASRTALTEGTTPKTYGGAPGNPIVENVVMKYNIIEFGGNEVAPGDELNNLSMYASKTNLSHVQTHRGLDDQFEAWGGEAEWEFLLATGGLDDDYDLDEGITGSITNIVGHKYPVACGGSPSGDPHGFEMDGTHSGTNNDCANNNLNRCTNVNIQNFTLIGAGVTNGEAMRLREGFAGTVQNGVVWNFAGGGSGLQIIRGGGESGFPVNNATLNNIGLPSNVTNQTIPPSVHGNGPSPVVLWIVNELPINSDGGISENCGFTENKPDYRTKGVFNTFVGGATTEWYKDWTVYRAR